jgi:hypothetical protein
VINRRALKRVMDMLSGDRGPQTAAAAAAANYDNDDADSNEMYTDMLNVGVGQVLH